MRNVLLVLIDVFIFSSKMDSHLFILPICERLGSHFYFPLKIIVVDTTLHFQDPFFCTSKLDSKS